VRAALTFNGRDFRGAERFGIPGGDTRCVPSPSSGGPMSALSLRLPNSLHERARDLARREGVSINQLVASALAEKMSALLTEEHLEARAARGSRSKFLAALAQVPDIEPEPRDRLPSASDRRAQPTKARARRARKAPAKPRPRG
jgi:hypothetical protein